ncbi:AAA family ATPase [Providencia rettgeri]
MNVLQELIEFMELKGWKQAHIARNSGLSGSVISQYLKGIYEGNVSAVETKIIQMMEREREKEKNRRLRPKFVMTGTASKGLEVIRIAHLEGDINVIYGDAGMGKTMMMREYAHQYSDAVLIEADPGYTARVILEELGNKLGVDVRGNMHDRSEAIIRALRDSGRVILVDEAENLPYRVLETLRRIHDKSGVGIVLAGMPRLIINLKGKRGEYKQLYSRAGFKLEMGDKLPEEDINQIAISTLPELEEQSDLLAALYKGCDGNARRLFKYLRGVARSSDIHKTPITVGMIKQFAKMLIN